MQILFFSSKNVNLKLPLKRAKLSVVVTGQLYATAYLPMRSYKFWLRILRRVCIQLQRVKLHRAEKRE